MKEVRVTFHLRKITIFFLGASLLSGCKDSDEGMWLAKLNEANEKVVLCKKEVNEQKVLLADLKQKLALAMSNPDRLQLTDPDVLNLIAELKAKRGARLEGDDVVLGKGDLSPKEASRIVRQGAQGLQICYERALKKSSSLQFQTGLFVTLEITVKPSGQVQTVDLTPHVDVGMTDCVRNTVMHWKFPTFGGQEVVLAQKLTLTPKT
jgi:hypothetical protein